MSTCTPATSTITHSNSNQRSSGYSFVYQAPAGYNGILEGHAVLMDGKWLDFWVTRVLVMLLSVVADLSQVFLLCGCDGQPTEWLC